MKPIYAIGDIHGQKTMLDYALSLITKDGGQDAKIVFLGDYTDRGPDSRGVIDTLIAGTQANPNWVCLKGNHDKMFANFVRDGLEHDPHVKSGISWLNPRLGGSATLASYGIEGQMHFTSHAENTLECLTHFEGNAGWEDKEALQALALQHIGAAHLDFLDTLPLVHETEDLIFVHAGLRPGLPINQQDPDDLIWIRDGFLESNHDFGRLVVHGHTALDHPKHFGNRIDLDGGAGYGDPLVPAVFEGRDCWLLTEKGRVPLLP